VDCTFSVFRFPIFTIVDTERRVCGLPVLIFHYLTQEGGGCVGAKL
jgi:hypothetical protein